MQTKLFSINEEDVVIAKDNKDEEYYVVGKYDDFFEWDFDCCPVGKLMTWHRRYHIGTDHDYKYPSDFWVDVLRQHGIEVEDNLSIEEYENLAADIPDFIFYPIFMYEHSGIALSMDDFNDRWDSGQLGVFCADKKEIESELGQANEVGWVQAFHDYVKAMLDEFNEWQIGNVWAFTYAPTKKLNEYKEAVDAYQKGLWRENLVSAIAKRSDGWCGCMAGDYDKCLRDFCDCECLKIVGVLENEDK